MTAILLAIVFVPVFTILVMVFHIEIPTWLVIILACTPAIMSVCIDGVFILAQRQHHRHHHREKMPNDLWKERQEHITKNL